MALSRDQSSTICMTYGALERYLAPFSPPMPALPPDSVKSRAQAVNLFCAHPPFLTRL
jgi:hypothetical protein